MRAREIFAQRIKSIRVERGLTQKQFGEIFGYHETHIRHLENARKTPTDQFGKMLDAYFHIPGELMRTLATQAQQDTSEFGALVELEQRADTLRVWDGRVVPGLLQTRSYAQAIVDDPALLDERLARQGVFEHEDAPFTHVVLSESVLYVLVGGSRVLRGQLQHLTCADAPWKLQIMPEVQGWHWGISGPLTLLEFRDDDPCAFVDSITGGTMVDDPEQMGALSKRWDAITADALSPGMSHEMIAGVIEELGEGPE